MSKFNLDPANRAAVTTLPDVPAIAPRRALYEDVAERLREQIYNRELEPGSWIDEQRLATEYGISRTPLREALKVLATEGLVTMKVRRGAYVTEMSRQDVRQVYHLLSLLEADAAADAARHATDVEMRNLRELHERLEREVRQREFFFASNEAFHMMLLEVGRNRWRTQMVQDLRKVMKLNRHHSLFTQGRLEESLMEHRELMAALESRDASAAAKLMQAHFDNGLAAAER